MKLKSVETEWVLYTIVRIDDENDQLYRKRGKGQWEILMGESWEPIFNTKIADELNALLEDWIRRPGQRLTD